MIYHEPLFNIYVKNDTYRIKKKRNCLFDYKTFMYPMPFAGGLILIDEMVHDSISHLMAIR